MNSESQESFQLNETPPVPVQPGRSRFTLLSDLPELAAPTKSPDQSSPVRMYLRELHEQQKLLQQKQNNDRELNRKEIAIDSKSEKEKFRSVFEGDKKIGNVGLERKDNNVINGSRRTCFDMTCEPDTKVRPGIYMYRKKINLAEPAERWQNLSDSSLRCSFNSKKHFRVDYGTFNYNEFKLFENALRKGQFK